MKIEFYIKSLLIGNLNISYQKYTKNIFQFEKLNYYIITRCQMPRNKKNELGTKEGLFILKIHLASCKSINGICHIHEC